MSLHPTVDDSLGGDTVLQQRIYTILYFTYCIKLIGGYHFRYLVAWIAKLMQKFATGIAELATHESLKRHRVIARLRDPDCEISAQLLQYHAKESEMIYRQEL